jgi:tetratricopeptide (TPR) repeat protein
VSLFSKGVPTALATCSSLRVVMGARQLVAKRPADILFNDLSIGPWSYVRRWSLSLAVRLAAGAPGVRLRLGQHFLHVGDYARAEQTLWTVLRLKPDSVPALIGIAHCCLRTGDSARGIPLYERALDLEPGNIGLRFSLANAWYESGELDRAMQVYRSVLQLDPKHARSHFNMGHVFKDMGQLEQSADSFHAALRADKSFYKARFMWAHVLSLRSRSSEAIEQYKLTIRHAPSYVKAYYNLGNCLLKEGQFDEAIGNYRVLLRIDETYEKAHFALGQAYLRVNRPKNARQAFSDALSLRPDHHLCRLQLAQVLDDLGRSYEAMLHYRIFLRDAPKSVEHDDVSRRLMSLMKRPVTQPNLVPTF